MINKKYSSSSKNWLSEHFNDQYVNQAHKKGLRSRAWFKIDELHQKDKIFKPGIVVLDLGSSPGSWSKYAKQHVGKTGKVIACDLLPMDPIVGVTFYQGDLYHIHMQQMLIECIGKNNAQVIMSDMSPKISGIPFLDVSRTMCLVKLALKIAINLLSPTGFFVVKLFQGENFKEHIKYIQDLFMRVNIRKPDASRSRSREVYVVAKDRK